MRAKGEGSVFKRPDGRWVAQISAGHDQATGNRRRLTRVRSSKKAAYEALAELRREVAQPAAFGEVTVELWCRQWLEDCAARVKAGTLAPKTVVGYESDVRRHIIPAVGHVRLDQLSPGHVARMMTAIQAAGMKPRTAGAARGTLSAALSAAVADGLLTVNVARAARPPARPSTSPSAFTDDELDRIAAVCADHRLGMLFLFAALTGLRTSELLGLEWQHVDLEEGRYQVVEGLHRIGATGAAAIGVEPGLLTSHPKTSGSGDGTPMSPAAVDVLRRWKAAQAAERLASSSWSDSGRVFTTAAGTPLDPSNVRRQWRKVLASAKVPATSRAGAGRGLHELRRTFASRLRRAGVSLEEVQRLGRWSSPAMLLAHYRAVDEVHLRDAAGAGDAGVAWLADS